MLNSLKEVTDLKVDNKRLYSATHEEIKSGATTDIYFINTRDVLESVNMLDTPVTAEIFTRTTGMFAGTLRSFRLSRDKFTRNIIKFMCLGNGCKRMRRSC